MHSDMLMTETSDCSGEQYDPDLGLYYLRARYYNSLTGRFLSRDPEAGKPTDPKTLHKYLYAGGDPVNVIDPSGRANLIEFMISIAKPVVYVTLAGLGAVIACEFLEDAEKLKEIVDANGEGTVVKPPGGISCGGPHPSPGGPGHPEPPEPPEPTPAPISGPPVGGSD